MKSAALIAAMVGAAGTAFAQPTVVQGGVLNAASFAKDSSGHGTAVAPGSLVSIFGSGLGSSQADADTVPFSMQLGGVSVTFGGFGATLRDVVPSASLVNAQMPFEILPSGQTSATVNVVVSFAGAMSAPIAVPIVPQAPGVFSIPPGVGTAVLVDISQGSPAFGAIAGPVGSITGLTTHPIPRGDLAYFYATGLGVMNPSVPNGSGGQPGVTYSVANMPQVLIGGIPVTPLFAGQAPGFPGVYQVNIQIPQNAPTGNNIDVQMVSADGTVTSPKQTATISIQ